MHRIVICLPLVLGLLMMPVAVLADDHGKKEKSEEVRVYDHRVIYEGIFDSERIYKMIDKESQWVGSTSPRTLIQVRCAAALIALEEQGSWYGRLNYDGTCTKGDPIEWAMGNYFNFVGQEPDADKGKKEK